MGFFKAYDMRGTFAADFDLGLVRRIGRALPKVVTPGGEHRRWLVGRDCRATSPDVARELKAGLAESGAEVTDLGLCTTPMVYFFTAEGGFDASVMVTASHNPPTDNGLKVSSSGARPVGYADGLNKVEEMVAGEAQDVQPSQADSVAPSCDESALARYIAWQREATPDDAFAGLRYAVDCSCGMSSIFARELFPGAMLLNDRLDGRFPAHSPNPLKADAREQVAKAVRENGLDCGVIFDGDADRAMFVDERGEFVQPDYLVPVVARATSAAKKARCSSGVPTKIIHDIRTSRGAIEALKEDGFEPVMVPVGHVFAKRALREVGALCGGELAGHYYFSEFHGCDSGVLAARRILAEIARAKRGGKTFSEMMAPISGRYANSGEVNFRVEDKTAAVERVLEAAAANLPPEVSRSRMDGIRVEYAQGWFNLRASNTEPYLRLVAECDTKERLAEWMRILTDAIEGKTA
ncbi:MAG: phosphomannomutase/phosphoglucomutase [Lentisphaerae bacterium]|nr:phosphomannomutase/phosphoglucomutase [Lentisphaerota bacterium]